MRRTLYFAMIAIGLALQARAADETNTPSTLSYGSFQIIPDRNIFNQNRSGRSRDYTRVRSERAPRTDAFTLRGTMSYEKGWFAFFDGTSADYRKAVQPVESIAGFKLLSVGPEGVKLESNGKQLELQVGRQMKRPEGGEWQLADANEVIETTAASSGSGESNNVQASASEPAPAAGGESDILKRLMQKREQELNAEAAKNEPRKD
jgi:hypothetical protein